MIDSMNSKSFHAPQHISKRPVQKLSASIKIDGAWNEVPKGAEETGQLYFFFLLADGHISKAVSPSLLHSSAYF